MASIDNHILTITEPTIKLDEVVFESFGEKEGDATKVETSKGYLIMISINGYVFSDKDVLNMTLDCNGSLPTIELTLSDNQGLFTIDTFPRDGDVINFRMGTLEKTSYKDIRIDFDITSADQPKQNSNVKGGKYSFSGRIKVPGLYADECKSYGVGTSLDHIESIANDLKLGVATNIDSADDKMNLILPYNSRFDTLEDLVKHSYIDEESFQAYCIDQFYYINYVNLNTLLESEESIEDIIAAYDREMNDVPGNGSEDAANQTKKPLILTNHKRDAGTNLFIEAQSLANSTGEKAKKNGYKRTLQYFENDSDEGLVSHEIEPLASKKMSDIEEPMKGRRDEDRFKNETKTKYTGRKNSDPETSHTHLNYEYSAISNAQNLDEVKKMSLEVSLASFNPAIHLYQKLPIAIYTNQQEKLGADKVIKTAKKEKGFDTTVEEDKSTVDPGEYVLDEFLSAYYVVGGIEYTFKAGYPSVKQKLKLLRREWPSRINNINPETVAPQPTPAAPPVTPPAPAPVEPPPTPEPPAKPEYTVSGKIESKIKNWTESVVQGEWKVTPEGSPAPSKINIEFKDTKTSAYNLQPAQVAADGKWTLNIAKEQIPVGKYNVTAKLEAPGGETAEGALGSTSVVKWTPDSVISGPDVIRLGNVFFRNEVKNGKEPDTFVGTYTQKGEATDNGNTSPMSGKVEGTDSRKVISDTQSAMRSEMS